MTDLLQTYVSAWPGIWVIDTTRYLVAAALMAAILRIFWRAGLARRKLQARDATVRDVRREVLASLRSALIFSLLGTMVFVAVRQGWVTVYRGFDEAGPIYLALSLAFMLIAHDTYFYWTHRAMHHRRLFALFHGTHHLSRTPTAWAAYSSSIPEAISSFVPLFIVFMPMHDVALFAFVAVQIVRNVMGDAGTELTASGPDAGSAGTTPRPITTCTTRPAATTTDFISAGGTSSWGTEHPDYRRKFESIAAPRAALEALKAEVRS